MNFKSFFLQNEGISADAQVLYTNKRRQLKGDSPLTPKEEKEMRDKIAGEGKAPPGSRARLSESSQWDGIRGDWIPYYRTYDIEGHRVGHIAEGLSLKDVIKSTIEQGYDMFHEGLPCHECGGEGRFGSECCGEPVTDSGLCSRCKEHAEGEPCPKCKGLGHSGWRPYSPELVAEYLK